MARRKAGAEGEAPDVIDPDTIETELEAEEELDFTTSGDRLPWLETDDDEIEERTIDAGRIVAFALVGLLLLGVLLGGIWVLSRGASGGGEAQVAEGGTIPAPAAPYKEKPARPGGKTVAGTGDTSFQVAEGKVVDGKVAQGPAKPVATASASEAPAAGGVGVQVGAYSSKAKAEDGWNTLAGKLGPLQGRSHRVVEGLADGTPVFRLQALAGSVAEADTLCRSIKAAGGDCQVKR